MLRRGGIRPAREQKRHVLRIDGVAMCSFLALISPMTQTEKWMAEEDLRF